MRWFPLIFWVLLTESFVVVPPPPGHGRRPIGAKKADDEEMVEIRERARRILEAPGEVVEEDPSNAGKGMIAGAVVGGFLGGPLGMLLGMNVGANMATSKTGGEITAKQRLFDLGVDDDLLKSVDEAEKDIKEASEAVDAATRSRDSASSVFRTLSRDRDAAQQAAMDAVQRGDDDDARSFLASRISLDDRVQKADLRLQEANDRLSQATTNLDFFTDRNNDLRDILARTVVATYDRKQRRQSSWSSSVDDSGSSSSDAFKPRDPLVEKFKRLEEKEARKNDRGY